MELLLQPLVEQKEYFAVTDFTCIVWLQQCSFFNLVCFDVTRRDDLRELLLQPPEEQKEGEEGEGAEPEEEVVYKYIPPEPKEWVSQGSEKEILEESVMESRGKVGSLHKIFPTLDSLSISSPPPPPPPQIIPPPPAPLPPPPPRITPYS